MIELRVWLKNSREKLGLTQNEMSEKLNIAQGYYSMIESGERQKSLDLSLVTKLSEILGVTVDFIVENEKQIEKR